AKAGAELGAPADPAEQYSAARPEWYYLFLFQLLKYFHGTQEYIGALVIPGVVMTILAVMPLVGRLTVGHWFNRAFIVLVLLAAAALTGLAFTEDYFVHVAQWMKWDHANHPKWLFATTNDKGEEIDNFDKTLSSSRDFLKAREEAERNSHRIVELVNRREVREDGKLSPALMVQRRGAVDLIRNDPLTQGPRLFGQHCASCHDYRDPADVKGEKGGLRFANSHRPQTDSEGKVKRDEKGEVVYDAPPPGAPNLSGFPSREWIKGLLNAAKIVEANIEPLPPSSDPKIAAAKDHPDNHKRSVVAPYFGNTAHKEGRMVKWVGAHGELLKDDPQKADDDVDAIAAALSAQARLRSQAELDRDEKLVERGVALVQKNCTNGCHRFGDSGQLGLAPDLTGYGSYEWMMGLVSDPTHKRFYRRENDRMPSFAANLDQPARHAVSLRELSLIVDWLRGEYYRAGDKQPVLSHSEEQAKLAARTARTVAEPRLALVGGPKPTNRQRAEDTFAHNCSACHSHVDAQGRGIAAENPTAPNLHGFASRTWLTGLLDANQFASDRYFGKTSHFEGEMADFVSSNLKTMDDEKKTKRDAIIAALSAEAALPAQAEADKKAQEDGTLAKGKSAMAETWDTASCIDCHKFRDEEDASDAPVLTGYGTKDWIVKMITDPSHESFYGESNDRMPSFGVDPPGAKQALLTAEEIDLVARWLRGEELDAVAPATTAAADK
ncbi:MAG TPA: hypothetical protein VFB96_25635, partial [Pirellulaceae bacterium]|nr:hypothetical protein [Pirellulaceae bacterium]